VEAPEIISGAWCFSFPIGTLMAEGWQPIVQRAWQRCKPWRCTSLGKIMANDEHLQKWGLNLESTSKMKVPLFFHVK